MKNGMPLLDFCELLHIQFITLCMYSRLLNDCVVCINSEINADVAVTKELVVIIRITFITLLYICSWNYQQKKERNTII